MLVSSCLTVLFVEPFWIGIYERNYDDKYEVCKITFGAEPKEAEVYSFILQNWPRLHFAVTADSLISSAESKNPKRRQRDIQKQMQVKSIGTKAQQALQQQREQNKIQRQTNKKLNRDLELAYKFTRRQSKKKAKHRGR